MQQKEGFKNYLSAHPNITKVSFIVLGLLCLMPFISAPVALVMGILFSFILGNPYEEASKKIINKLLKISVIGLGFGMNAFSALKAGREGFLFTVVSIISVMLLGYLLSRVLKIEKITGYLISAGTAICGGSAIAAVSPLVKATPNQISVALAVVFTLNSVGLIIFPVIGHLLVLSQQDFGLWCAIAIHDTSSVVGAASKYGAEALEVATTVKLARALWIIPLSFFTVMLFKNKETKINIPWFIGLFIIAMLLNTYFTPVQKISPYIVAVAKAGLTLTLFLIGAGLSKKVLKSVGVKPLVLAVLLWIIISVGSLLVILN